MEKTKQEIRKECRNARMALSECEVEEASRRAAGFLLKDADYRKVETILAYIDTQQEISTRAILEDAWRCGKTTAVPRVEGKTMEFYQITSYEDLEPGHFGVWEPKVYCPVYEGPSALLLVPGVAFDREGRRIGYGGGFYDRYLEKHPDHHTVGYAYAFQIYEHLPTEVFDRRVDRVLTENGFLKYTGEREQTK